jgi:hypothetical protein
VESHIGAEVVVLAGHSRVFNGTGGYSAYFWDGIDLKGNELQVNRGKRT